MPSESEIFSLPNAPAPLHIAYITHKAQAIGDSVVAHLTRLHQVQLPDEFIACCAQLDQQRRAITAQYDSPDSDPQLFADYCHILSSVTRDIDVSAANLPIQWGSKTISDVNFEVCCLGYNVCVGICRSLATTPLSDQVSLQRFITRAQIAKAIIGRVAECHDESYSVLPIASVRQLTSTIDAFYFHATVGTVLLKNPKSFALLAKVAMATSNKYTECSLHEYARYFRIFALVKMAEDCFAKGQYGNGVGYGNAAFALVPSAKPKKGEVSVKKLSAPLLTPFKALFDQNKKDNDKLYFERVPAPGELPEIPLPKLQCAPKYSWESSIVVPDFRAKVATTSSDEVQKRYDNIQSEASKALADIDRALAQFPEAALAGLERAHADLAVAKGEALNLIAAVEGRIAANHPYVYQRCPDAFQCLCAQKEYVAASANADGYYESEYVKLSGIMQGMKAAQQFLAGAKSNIAAIANEAEQLFSNTVTSLGDNTDPQSIVAVSTRATNDFGALAARLNGVFATLSPDQFASVHPQTFDASAQTILAAFEKGTQCYTQIKSNLLSIQSKIQ